MTKPTARRMAIVHERFTEVAGSEQVVEQLSAQWPQARIHGAIARPEGIPTGLSRPPQTTWLDRGYRILGQRSYAPLLPLMPRAFRGMDLTGADAVIVSHHAFATQAAFATEAPVVAYVHSPARWAWDPALRAGEAGGRLGSVALAALSRLARNCETEAAKRLSMIVANSTAVAERIAHWWKRDAIVVHPPVDTVGFTPDHAVHREEFFLLAGRLVPYKRPDIAVLAARVADMPLVVAGDGRWMATCRNLAGPKTTFLGHVPHDELLALHRRARALLMPGVEDFGIVPVESMATGTPVIALGAGGARDTVIPGVTGMHVANGADPEIVDRFASALRDFHGLDYDPAAIRAFAEGFSRAAFRRKMAGVIDDLG